MNQSKILKSVAIVAMGLLLQSCGGGGGGSEPPAASPPPPAAPPPPPPPPPPGSNGLTSVTGTVALPAGAAIAPANLTLIGAFGEAPVGAQGGFELRVWSAGRQLAAARTANGDAVLLGWVGSGGAQLSARSTAEVLLYFALDGARAAKPSRDFLLTQLQTRAEVATLADAIAAALATTPSLATPTVRDALARARDALLSDPTVIAARASAASTIVKPQGVLVNPALPKSGVALDQQGIDTIFFTNSYRRRAVAHIERIGLKLEGATTEQSVRETFRTVDVSPVQGLTSLLGSFGDIVRGDMAWAPTTTSPLLLPINPSNAELTRYRVTLLGMGVGTTVDTLNAEQEALLLKTQVKTIVLDMVVPVIANVILDAAGDKLDEITNFGLAGEISQDLVTALAPVAQRASSGDIKGAVGEVINGVLTGNAIRPLILAYVWDLMSPTPWAQHLGYDKMFEGFNRGNELLAVLSKIDAGLTIVDTAAQTAHIRSSHVAESWEVVVNRSKVYLSPKRGWISPRTETSHVLTAKVVDADSQTDRTIVYRFSTSGRFGVLYDTRQQRNEDAFETVDPTVYYVPKNLTSEGTDTVTVEAFLTAAGTTNRQPLGSDTSTVEVRLPKVTITPQRSSVQPNGSVTLTAQVPDSLVAAGEYLAFRWSTTGKFGRFDNNLTTVDSGLVTGRSHQVQFRSHSRDEGIDTVTVEVTQLPFTTLGVANATVKNELRKSLESGELTTQSWTVPGAGCTYVYIKVPKVAGATGYSVHAYNFFDSLFWGREISVFITAAATWPPYNPASCGSPAITDRGDSYWYMVTGGSRGDGVPPPASDMLPRFTGMEIEVTITY
jgi:hypothetical protein